MISVLPIPNTKLPAWEQLYTCPQTGCDGDVYADNFNIEDDVAWREVECHDCGRIWVEIFEFMYNEELP